MHSFIWMSSGRTCPSEGTFCDIVTHLYQWIKDAETHVQTGDGAK